VALRDFKGSKQDIAKRLGSKALSYGLLENGIVQHRTGAKAWTKAGTNLARAKMKKYEKQLLLGGAGSTDAVAASA
jgi:electron transfer flavoprotein alpha/beta subunit